MPQRTLAARIAQLDPERDHQAIVALSTSYEFPFDVTRSLEIALFRTYAVPSIGGLLDRTGEFEHRPQKRYDDTALLLSLLYSYGYDSERGRAALRNMNRQHGRYTISNYDFLYVLSTFVVETPRWLEKYGWRAMTRHEVLALYYFWRGIGERMNIKNIPASYEELLAFSAQYERAHFAFSEGGQRTALRSRDMFLGWFLPRPLYPLGAPFIYAMLDDPLLEAFRFPKPPGWLRAIVSGALKLRARFIRLMGDRRRPHIIADQPQRTYPHGYRIEDLGPRISKQ